MTGPTDTGARLYGLLPEIVRARDEGLPLRELVEILAAQVDVVREELDRFYDDQFIETCAEWAAPYLGELLGYRPVRGLAPDAVSARAEIANTIRYRRGKGTAATLEQLARDVTGWPARVVEYFERLATTQYLNHVRPHAVAHADLRDREALGWAVRMDGAFDDVAHTADVRRIGATDPYLRGRHNIPDIGIFLWRTEPMPLVRAPLRPHTTDRERFRFDPTGTDAPLFSRPRHSAELAGQVGPADVPLPLTVRWTADHRSEQYGSERSLLLETPAAGGGTDVEEVPLAGVRICDLRDRPGGGWENRPPADVVAIDPALGRVWFGTALPDARRPVATYVAGLAVPVGARTIRRVPPAERPLGPAPTTAYPAPEARLTATDPPAALPAALTAARGGGTVRILDSSHWPVGLTLGTDPVADGEAPALLALVSDASARPVVEHEDGVRLEVAPGGTVILDGLMVAGGPVVLEESGDDAPRTVILRDCTLVPGLGRTASGEPASPGLASLVVLDPFATVVLDGCVTGPVVAVEGSVLEVHGSVVDAGRRDAVAVTGRGSAGGLRGVTTAADLKVGDGTAEAGSVRLDTSTVVGGVHATRLDCSDSMLLAELAPGDPRLAAVWAQRRQVGCVRFTWLPTASRTGRRFRCQPDREAPAGVQDAMRPVLTSVRFGDPGYMQMQASTPSPIRRGADDESEMGATHDLYTPQREDDLVVRLEEYLRFGLEAGIFHAT